MSATYRVVISGLQEGFSKDQVNGNLATLFKTTIDNLPNIFDQSTYVVKKNIDLDTANKYQALIQQQGCVCSVEPEVAVELTLDDVPQANPNNAVAETATSKTTKFCHKCGFQLPITAKFCRGCGSTQSKIVNNANQSDSSVIQPIFEAPKSIHESVKPSSATASNQLKDKVVVEKSSKTKIIASGVLAIVMAGIGLGIWLKNKPSEPPVPSLSATESTTLDREQTDTVAGKFTIKSTDLGEYEFLLGDKEIEKCGVGLKDGECAGEAFGIEKTFNVAGKTVVVTSAVNGTSCPATFQFYTISKVGDHQKVDGIGNCRELEFGSLTQSGYKVILSLPTIEKNMTGTEVWTYEDGKITGPVKTVKTKFNVDLNKIQKITNTTNEGDIHNAVAGTVIKEDNLYFLKFETPVVLDAVYFRLNGDIVDNLQIDTDDVNGTQRIPKLGKGTFDVVMNCAEAGCLLTINNEAVNTEATPTNTTESAIPKAFQGAWADADGCAKFKSSGEFDPGAVITSDHINRYEHNCVLAKVTATSTNSFSGEFTCSQEGEMTNETISLTLQPDGKLAGISNNALPMCK